MTTTNEPLSGVALAVEVAKSVMGWHRNEYARDENNAYPSFAASDNNIVVCMSRFDGCRDWHPWRDPRAYMEIVEHCRKLWRTDNPEELYWQFVDCQEYGWRVDVMWSHHDGDVDAYSASAEMLGEAVMLAALQTVRTQKP
jgi:hypothetical protein